MDNSDRDAVAALRARFEALGADDPERWALSEITELLYCTTHAWK